MSMPGGPGSGPLESEGGHDGTAAPAVEVEKALVDVQAGFLQYDRISINMEPEGVLGRGENGEVRSGTVDGRPAAFKVSLSKSHQRKLFAPVVLAPAVTPRAARPRYVRPYNWRSGLYPLRAGASSGGSAPGAVNAPKHCKLLRNGYA